MKKFWIALAIIVPMGAIIGAIVWGKSIWDKLSFKPYFISANLGGLSLTDIPDIVLSGQERTLNAKLGLEIKNDSSTAIKFCNLKAILSYKGIEIARTSDQLAQSCSSIPANDVLKQEDDITIKLNRGGASLLTEKLLGKNPVINYEIDLSILGIPVSKILSLFGMTKKNSFEWK